jgi:CRISPR-associated protein Cas6
MREVEASAFVDVAFALRGEAIDPDHAFALRDAVLGVLTWMGDLAEAGIHPLKGVTPSGDRLVVARRAQLMLRLPRGQAAAASALSGTILDLGGAVEVGGATERELAPYPVLYSHFVDVGCDPEGEFVAEAARRVAATGVDARLIVGRHHAARSAGICVTGYSLMLHGLSPEHSLRLQETGLGANRMLGCGIFVPHKSIAAVGL